MRTSWNRLMSASYSFMAFLTFCFIAVSARALLAFIFFLDSFSFARAVVSDASRLTSVRV